MFAFYEYKINLIKLHFVNTVTKDTQKIIILYDRCVYLNLPGFIIFNDKRISPFIDREMLFIIIRSG